jgi:FkbM family methyltransferase
MSDSSVHTFDNGVRVMDCHLLQVQRARYQLRNVHEADEEDIFMDALARTPHGGTFLNVGTAIGYYVILAKLKRPDLVVHGVEPLPSHIERFRENLALNRLVGSDIRLHQCAVSSRDDPEARLLDDSYGSKLVDPAAPAAGRIVKVAATTLARLCAIVGTRVDLVQMDIQGLEQAVLEAFFSTSDRSVVSAFLIGTHGEGIHSAILALMKRNGYEVLREEVQPSNQPDGIVMAIRRF